MNEEHNMRVSMVPLQDAFPYAICSISENDKSRCGESCLFCFVVNKSGESGHTGGKKNEAEASPEPYKISIMFFHLDRGENEYLNE